MLTVPPSNPARVVVLASGTGSLFRALLDASSAPEHPVRIVALGVDRECAATEHAHAAGVTTFRVSLRDFATREQWDVALADAVAAHTPDLVVTAGFMKILGPRFLDFFAGRIVNSHPALLPSFPGAHAVRDALAYGVKVTGTTVHLVDGGIDTGPILAQEAVVGTLRRRRGHPARTHQSGGAKTVGGRGHGDRRARRRVGWTKGHDR